MTLLGRRVVSCALSLALHACGIGLLLLLRPPLAPDAGGRTVAVLHVPAPAAPSTTDRIAELEGVIDGIPAESFRIPGFEFDVGKIRARQDDLFPFLTEELTVLDDVKAVAAERATQMTWQTEAARKRSSSRLPPLEISDMELWDLVDAAWSRRERWRTFEKIATMVATHDPDSERSADLLRTHIDQNLLQPYYDSASRDPRFWVMLNLAADHGLLVRFASTFVREHPSTLAATELLFLLDEYAQASRDALLMLIATDPEHQLRLTREGNPDAHALAVQVRDRYLTWLRARDLDTTHRIRGFYDGIRMRILRTIVETTPGGYGAADAQYLIGMILWDQNRIADAVAAWRQIGSDRRRMYEPVYTEIRRELEAAPRPSVVRISAILGAEYRHWLEFSKQRLAEFGYALDSF